MNKSDDQCIHSDDNVDICKNLNQGILSLHHMNLSDKISAPSLDNPGIINIFHKVKTMPSSMKCPVHDCEGGDGDTAFKTKNCQTIELTPGELEFHVNDLDAIKMNFSKCDFITPKGNQESVMYLMESHIMLLRNISSQN